MLSRPVSLKIKAMGACVPTLKEINKQDKLSICRAIQLTTKEFDKYLGNYNEKEDIYDSCRHGDLLGLYHLIFQGANLDLQNNDGYTALMRASLCDKDKCVKILVDAGAKLDLQDNNDNTALMRASLYGNDKCVKILVDAGAKLDLQNKYGSTALMHASNNGRDKCVKILVDAGAKFDLQNIYGNTALSCASLNGNDNCVKILVDAGATLLSDHITTPRPVVGFN